MLLEVRRILTWFRIYRLYRDLLSGPTIHTILITDRDLLSGPTKLTILQTDRDLLNIDRKSRCGVCSKYFQVHHSYQGLRNQTMMKNPSPTNATKNDVPISIQKFVCLYVGMYVCMYVRTYVCMYVCMYFWYVSGTWTLYVVRLPGPIFLAGPTQVPIKFLCFSSFFVCVLSFYRVISRSQ